MSNPTPNLGSILFAKGLTYNDFNEESRCLGVAVPTRDLQEQFDDWWRPEYADWWTPHRVVAEQGRLIEKQTDRPTPAPVLGRLSWPTTPSRWSTFFCVMTGKDLDSLKTMVQSGDFTEYDDGTIADFYTELLLQLSDGRYYIQARMNMLPPRPAFVSKDGQQLYLVCLVDQRWRWHQTRVHEFTFYPDYGTSWNDMLFSTGAMFADCLILEGDNADSVAAAYLTPDPQRWPYPDNNQRWDNSTYAEFLEAFSTATSMRLAFGYAYGSFADDVTTSPQVYQGIFNYATAPEYTYGYLRTATNAKTIADAQWTKWQDEIRTGGQVTLENLCYTLPDRVRVSFGGAALRSDVKQKLFTDTGLSVGTGRPLIGNQGVWLEADANASTADSDKDAWALQAAKDWYTWRLADRVDATFKGIIPWQPSGTEACIEWTVSFDPLDAFTRVIPHPQNGWNVYRDNDESHVILAEVNAPYNGNTSYTNFGIDGATPVRWIGGETGIGDMASQGDFDSDDPAPVVALSVPGELPVAGHHYVAFRQNDETALVDGTGTSFGVKNYIASPRGYVLVKRGNRHTDSGIHTEGGVGGGDSSYYDMYDGEAFIMDGRYLRSVGQCYMRVRRTVHSLMVDQEYYKCHESGRYTQPGDGTSLRLYTWEGSRTGSIYDGGTLSDLTTTDPSYVGPHEGLPGYFVNSMPSSISLTITTKDSSNFTATVTSIFTNTEIHFGVSPANYVNGLTSKAVAGTTLSSTATFTVPPPPSPPAS